MPGMPAIISPKQMLDQRAQKTSNHFNKPDEHSEQGEQGQVEITHSPTRTRAICVRHRRLIDPGCEDGLVFLIVPI